MNIITRQFMQADKPVKALVFYQNLLDNSKALIETYDFNEAHRPVNAHPLSEKEIAQLAEQLNQQLQKNTAFLFPQTIISPNVLFVNYHQGFVVWYTPAQKVNLFFDKKLHITDGVAMVPPLVWKASKESLSVFALQTVVRPEPSTTLCRAPFFNVYDSGGVCMGTVDIAFEKDCSLEDFTRRWEHYFWNSKFSHLNGNDSPVKGNLVTIWKDRIGKEEPFPLDVLKPTKKTLKDLI